MSPKDLKMRSPAPASPTRVSRGRIANSPAPRRIVSSVRAGAFMSVGPRGGRRDARRHAAALAPAQCRHGDARGLEVSPGGCGSNLVTRAFPSPGLASLRLEPRNGRFRYARFDPPPLKWSDLRYVFDIQEDCNGEAAAGRRSGLAGATHGGRNPPDRGERGDVLSVAPEVWRAGDRAGEALKG